MPNGTVLFVDDEISILKSITRLFYNEGCKVMTALNAAEGLSLLDEQPVHVVVSDQRMPDMSGSEFLTQVRKFHPQVIRITMSGYADIASVIECINEAHIHHFIPKPWDSEQLKSIVLHYLSVASNMRSNAVGEHEHFYFN
ncbi:response regulator [Vibrio sp. S4M6]|uniref:response regulator n=1 Tax=Vibrio sinus TaxID=2946865 RepID=UPI00202A5F7A|nr:response regulator [Vibrio sinus]MCL9781193.1 response regulator [Vibrio sinus]